MTLFRLLHALGAALPGGFPHATALGNRVLRPLYGGSRGRVRVSVWDGLLFDVDPSETIGGNLAFAPRAFEYHERRFLEGCLREGGSFVDVGANIGIFSLFAARLVGPSGRVVAFEPDPQNAAMLREHVRLNGFERIVECVELGISARSETRHVSTPNPANRGATVLTATGSGPAVQCVALAEALEATSCANVDVLKIDIEGQELEVLEPLFAEVAAGRAPAPAHLIVEAEGGPHSADAGYVERLGAAIEGAGYRLGRRGLNSFYSLQ